MDFFLLEQMLKSYAQDGGHVNGRPMAADARRVYDGRMKAARVGVAITVLALTACTGRSVEPQPQTASSITTKPPSVAADVSCTKAEIAAAVALFIGAWNHGNSAALNEALTRKAAISIWVLHGANTVADAGAGTYTTSTGWPENRRLMRHQHTAGQRLSFDRLRIVAREGAYALGMRSMYEDGPSLVLRDAKFAYSCANHALERVVLVAPER